MQLLIKMKKTKLIEKIKIILMLIIYSPIILILYIMDRLIGHERL